MKAINVIDYKKRRIVVIMDGYGQSFAVVIGRSIVFHTIADAKRFLDGNDYYTYEPLMPTHPYAREIVAYAMQRYRADGGLPEAHINPNFNCD